MRAVFAGPSPQEKVRAASQFWKRRGPRNLRLRRLLRDSTGGFGAPGRLEGEAKELALRMRCSNCGKKVAEVVAVSRPRPRSPGPKDPHPRRVWATPETTTPRNRGVCRVAKRSNARR